MTRFKLIAVSFGLLFFVALAHAQETVDALLALKDPPPGVVFEVFEGSEKALDWAIPEITAHAKKLRERFPGLDIAVVTHGQEMFALQAIRVEQNRKVHDLVRNLTKQENIPVHVCETFAGTRSVKAEAFPDYVNVAPYAPAQIENYMALGYILVKLKKPAPR